MPRYYYIYRYEGNEYSFEIPADSLEEAEARKSLMCLARHEGEVIFSLPLPFFKLELLREKE